MRGWSRRTPAVQSARAAAIRTSRAAKVRIGMDMYYKSAMPISRRVFLGSALAAGARAAEDVPFRVVEARIGTPVKVKLADGTTAAVLVREAGETRDSVRGAVRAVRVEAEVNGERVALGSGTYHLPVAAGGVQIDCPFTRHYMTNAHQNSWALAGDVRLRLWPAGSPWLRPGSFLYPARQRWFADRYADVQRAELRQRRGAVRPQADLLSQRARYRRRGGAGGGGGGDRWDAGAGGKGSSEGPRAIAGEPALRRALRGGRTRLVLPLQPSAFVRAGAGAGRSACGRARSSGCSARRARAADGRTCISRSRAGSRRASGAPKTATRFCGRRTSASSGRS